ATAPVRADPTPEDRSRDLFGQARDLADRGQWAQACPLFQAAHDLHATGGTALQTANCYEKIGSPERALPLYRWVLDPAHGDKNEERAAIAKERVQVLEGHTPAPVGSGTAPGAPSASPAATGTEPVAPAPSRVPAYAAFGVGAAGL